MSEAPDVLFWHMSCLAFCEEPSQILHSMYRKQLDLWEVKCETVECIVMAKGKV